MSESFETAAPSPSDKIDIAETCTRMAVYADRREWTLLCGLFADKVLLDYTSLGGGEPVRLTPQEIADSWAATLGGFDATQHLIANHLVQVDGDRAVCTASFQATHRLATPHGAPLWTLGGDYRWELTRVGGRWLIGSVVMTATWGDGNKDLPAQAAG
ncbi:nuclear transport factor 2 family protein [Streptosporangium sp. NBC_01756]|uniref:nuclear transport factor 2 family protein n=1 Tax=Streptosporangium sp. NBC_01756 TaxID=2975950 RepID=UPI002DDA3568|nr:nuclear transport factor 2 family protein [Streptosporangium sp. NBC_01756]WSC86339.1 nuclear transport factor 2 family protein [Streptosporangium sp. NBC_01756]